MKQYIERDAAIRTAIQAVTAYSLQITGNGITQFDGVDVANRMEMIPVADVVERVRGEWVLCYEDDRRQIDGDKYTACGFEHYGNCISHYHFCPNCGADMRGEANDNR